MARRTIKLWNEDPFFVQIGRQIKDHTLIHKERLFILYQFANLVISLSLPGNVAELGVYKGGSAKLLAKTFGKVQGKIVHLFDTFTGMPKTDPQRDIHKQGDFADTTMEGVHKFLGDCSNIRLHQGLFAETLPRITSETFCYVHVDCDIYNSIRECCEFFYPRLVRGGVLIFDDYGIITCPGARIAVDEYFKDKRERPVYLPNGQCLVVKYTDIGEAD